MTCKPAASGMRQLTRQLTLHRSNTTIRTSTSGRIVGNGRASGAYLAERLAVLRKSWNSNEAVSRKEQTQPAEKDGKVSAYRGTGCQVTGSPPAPFPCWQHVHRQLTRHLVHH